MFRLAVVLSLLVASSVQQCPEGYKFLGSAVGGLCTTGTIYSAGGCCIQIDSATATPCEDAVSVSTGKSDCAALSAQGYCMNSIMEELMFAKCRKTCNRCT